jgi:hypothetical protein
MSKSSSLLRWWRVQKLLEQYARLDPTTATQVRHIYYHTLRPSGDSAAKAIKAAYDKEV